MINKNYSDILVRESGEAMVDLASYPFVLEPTQFRRGFTPNPQLWVRQSVAMKLEQVQREVLEPKGLRFKIFDAWRPRDVQDKVYAAYWQSLAQRQPDAAPEVIDRAVRHFSVKGSDTAFIPPHATGGAVDLTLVEAATNTPLDMGSDYLSWGPRALERAFGQAAEGEAGEQPDDAPQNLRELVIAMQQAGFIQDREQWWHFDYGNQKWALQAGSDIAIYGELDGSMGFMKKNTGFGHGITLPYEMR